MEVSEASSGSMDVMSQFMDVITTFKCKGCEYVCYKQEELVQHVKTVHLPQEPIRSEPAPSSVPEDESDVLVGVGGETTDASTSSLIATLVDEADNNPESYIPGTNLHEINIQTYGVDGTASNQVVLLDSGPNRSDLFPPPPSSRNISQREVFLCGNCEMHFQTIEECKTHMVEVHKVSMDDLATSQSLDLADTDLGADGGLLQAAREPQSLLSAAAGTEGGDKGQRLRSLISDREEMPDGRVSMSTQVVRKKVGRKSKAELEELARQESEAEQSSTTVTVSTGMVVGGAAVGEEEEEEEAEITYIDIEIPGKRKRRIPKHLADSYWLPKKVDSMDDDADYEVDSRQYRQTTRPYKVRRSSSPKAKTDYPFKCELCRARFLTEDKLEYHIKTHSNTTDKNGATVISYVCPEVQCKDQNKFQTTIWAEFKHHAWKEHKVDLGMIKCDMCDYRATVRSKLAIHKQIHSNEKPYICDICHKGFKQQSQLKNHALVHVAGVDVKEKESMSGRHWFVQAQCDICKRTFANQKSLQCHIEALHDKVRPFACKFCGHTAARKAMMQLHMRTHTGEKPFKCTLCDYMTGDHNSMRRHRMRHTGDKPYQCPHCSYACIQAVSLKLHLRSKHPGSDRSYSCSKCPYRTVNKNLFSNHLRDHEMGLIDESVLVPSNEEFPQPYGPKPPQPSLGLGVSIKLGTVKDLTDGTSNTTQLICSALNAIAPSLTEDGEPLPDNIETTVETLAEEGDIRHKITFHIPATLTKNSRTAEVIVQEQMSALAAAELDPLQAAAIESEIPTEAEAALALEEGIHDVSTEAADTLQALQQSSVVVEAKDQQQQQPLHQQAGNLDEATLTTI